MKEFLMSETGLTIIALVLTTIIGYFANNPKYIKFKKALKLLNEAIKDGKVTPQEVEEMINLFKEGKISEAHKNLKDK